MGIFWGCRSLPRKFTMGSLSNNPAAGTIEALLLFPGNTDINNGNLKLILGLIWSLIAHYQLGASNFPPKKLMLAWLKVRNWLRQK